MSKRAVLTVRRGKRVFTGWYWVVIIHVETYSAGLINLKQNGDACCQVVFEQRQMLAFFYKEVNRCYEKMHNH